MTVTEEVVAIAYAVFKHSNRANWNVKDRQIQAMRRAIETAFQQTNQAWIDINETTPKYDTEIIIKTIDGVFDVDSLCSRTKIWHTYARSTTVTHWMPLPEYKGDSL